jgi:5-formyltetrahydrofolate cyclo-ligase
MPPRDHSADAGGDPALLADKRAVRERVWSALTDAGVARFPGARHRIPNFTGAEAAAERLRGTGAWRAAALVKANPDAPQWPVRQRALEDGKRLLVAVPRLAGEQPFLLLDPARLTVTPRQASSIKGAAIHGVPVGVDDLEPIDLVVVGCVAADRGGARLGKGGGFADLELAVTASAGLVGPRTTLATTVHPLQLLAAGEVPTGPHDVPLDLIVTPDEVLPVPGERAVPALDWGALTPEKVAAIPLLSRLRGIPRAAR